MFLHGVCQVGFLCLSLIVKSTINFILISNIFLPDWNKVVNYFILGIYFRFFFLLHPCTRLAQCQGQENWTPKVTRVFSKILYAVYVRFQYFKSLSCSVMPPFQLLLNLTKIHCGSKILWATNTGVLENRETLPKAVAYSTIAHFTVHT